MSLLINGDLHNVPGATTIAPASHGGPAWAELSSKDCRPRGTTWVRQIILHSTKGDWPQSVVPGAGSPGRPQAVADFWRDDPKSSGAHIVVGCQGEVACLCDLAKTTAFHAEASNGWSIGLEMYQTSSGGVFEATLAATATLVQWLCNHLGIPQQMPRGPYRNEPLRRMEVGGKQLGGQNCVGVFGHRDNSSNRGRGDPGDEIFTRLAALGFEGLDYDGLEDIAVGRHRQTVLNARGARLTPDGVCGPASWRAMLAAGFTRWRDVR